MTYYPMSEWRVISIIESKAKHKKYTAVLVSGKKTVAVHFGDRRYQQYKDQTRLGIFSYLDHLDLKRRKNFIARQSVYVEPGFYSPAYFSIRWLW